MKTQSKKIIAIFAVVLCVLLAAVGGWLWFDSHVDRSGWLDQNGVLTYLDFHGKKVTGWQEIDGEIYFFDDAYAMQTGWQTIDGKRFHFGPDGVWSRGWQTIDGQRYYFDGDGIAQILWQDIDGGRYYFDRDGSMVTGWKKIDGRRYYFDDDGQMATGWREIGRDRYHFLADGVPLVGTATLEDGDYYFLEDGSMFTGWLERDEKKYFYRSGGQKAFGWTEIDGKLYFFDDTGAMETGWHEEGEYRYYLQEDGSAAVGPTVIDGNTYFFTPKGIQVVLVNRLNPVPAYYDLKLEILVEWHQVAQIALEPLQRMLADCEAAGIEYTFNSGYRSLKNQRAILETRTDEYIGRGMDPDNALLEALKTVAVPGTSEHHLGLAVDILGEEAIAWLHEHCWEYGFIVRYRAEKEDITGFIDEPWHFRYVGTRVSMDMKDIDLCLEEYLNAVDYRG